MPYTNNKCTDQPARPLSLISAFVVRRLDGIIPQVFISEISSLYLASVVEQAGLSLPWSQTPKTGFLAMRLIYHCWVHCNANLYVLVVRSTKHLNLAVVSYSRQISVD